MLTLGEIQAGMSRLNNWALDGQSITKDWEFKHFREAVEFLNRVKDVCVEKNHYPSVLVDGVSLRLVLTTKYEKALTEKDFELAEALDKIVM